MDVGRNEQCNVQKKENTGMCQGRKEHKIYKKQTCRNNEEQIEEQQVGGTL